MMTTQVVIVDDMEQVRQDLRTLLTLSENIEIVGEAANGLDAIHKVESLQPDVLLLDLEMPLLDGYQTASHIKKLHPSCRIVALTVHDYDAARQKALQAGVDHFVVKGTPIENLVQMILDKP